MGASRLCQAFGVPLSSHTAPSLHVHVACAVTPLVHVEYLYDHVRIERMLFDGHRTPRAGRLAPDLTRPGLGVEFKRADAARYAV
jgi:L-alanine-DL-glutamate epimerase-like enolase superfamily enzyme